VYYATHLNLWLMKDVRIEEEMFWFLHLHYYWCALDGS
jgi:hypothetical protein